MNPDYYHFKDNVSFRLLKFRFHYIGLQPYITSVRFLIKYFSNSGSSHDLLKFIAHLPSYDTTPQLYGELTPESRNDKGRDKKEHQFTSADGILCTPCRSRRPYGVCLRDSLKAAYAVRSDRCRAFCSRYIMLLPAVRTFVHSGLSCHIGQLLQDSQRQRIRLWKNFYGILYALQVLA